MFTALTGLQSNQSWIDVIGNNLANSNTPGFKSSRVTFNDLFARNLSYATAPTGSIGGRNPTQIGYGVSVGDIAHSFDQGALTDTGRVFDLALKGAGFFALSNGGFDLYTRVGTFGLDQNSDLVDLATGYHVQSPTGDDVNLDVQSLFPPKATSSVTYSGNLPGEVQGPLAEVLS